MQLGLPQMRFLKKKRLESTSVQSQIDNNKLNTTDISNIEGKKVWFWNKSANKTNLNIEKEGEDVDLKDMEESKTE